MCGNCCKFKIFVFFEKLPNISWRIKTHFSQRLTCDLGELFKGNTSDKSVTNIKRPKLPLEQNNYAGHKALFHSGCRGTGRIHLETLPVQEAAHNKSGLHLSLAIYNLPFQNSATGNQILSTSSRQWYESFQINPCSQFLCLCFIYFCGILFLLFFSKNMQITFN